MNIGNIVGAAITNATKSRLDKASYQIPIGALFIVPVFLAVGLLFVPESPRYLLDKGKTEQARKALRTLRGDSVAPEFVELEWAEMLKGIEEEKRIATTVGVLDMLKSAPPIQHFTNQRLTPRSSQTPTSAARSSATA